MNVNNVLLTATLAIGFVACTNEELSQGEHNAQVDKGTAFAGLYISAVTQTTRAITDNQSDYTGRTEEGTLISLDLLSTAQAQTWGFATSESAGKFWETSADSKVFKVSPWKTIAGEQTMALLLNKGTLNPNIAAAPAYIFPTTDPSPATNIATIQVLSTDGAFVMTSKVEKKTVLEGKDEATVKAGADETANVFTFDMERVVAQGLVAKEATLTADTKDGKGSVDLNNLTYSAVNGGAKTYLFADNAGERTLSDGTGLYKDFKSVIDDFKDFENAQDPNLVSAYLVRPGAIAAASGDHTNDGLAAYKAISVFADESSAKAARGIYFMENSVTKDAATWTKENKNFGFYRLAYAKVYATFTPKRVLTLDAGNNLVEEDGTKGMTFYKGETDGLLYKTKEAAKKSQLSPNQKAYTYTNGRAAYRALWNRQGTTSGTEFTLNNADVRRNNVYLLTIEAFQGLGMPWDASDPNDPNLPKPTDPEEPANPDNPDVEKQDTYMRVEAKVLPWNLVSRKVTLD